MYATFTFRAIAFLSERNQFQIITYSTTYLSSLCLFVFITEVDPVKMSPP